LFSGITLLDSRFYIFSSGTAHHWRMTDCDFLALSIQKPVDERDVFLWILCLFREMKTCMKKPFHILFCYSPIQENGDPVVPIHMICSIDPWLASQNRNKFRIALHIKDIHRKILRQTKLTSWYFQEKSKPLSAPFMAKHRMFRTFEKWIVRKDSILFPDIVQHLYPIHLLTSSFKLSAVLSCRIHLLQYSLRSFHSSFLSPMPSAKEKVKNNLYRLFQISAQKYGSQERPCGKKNQ